MSIFVSLSKEWSEKLDNQNFSEYSKYTAYFKKFISKLMEIGNAKALDEVDRICSSICNQFFVSEKKSINKRGLLVVSDVYAKINDKVNDDQLKLCTSKEGLSFFKNIEFDLSKSLEKFDYYEARDHILKINDLLNILVVSVMTTKQKNEKSLLKVIISISDYLKGYFSWLSKQDYDLSSTVKDQLYSGMFEIGNKYGNSKNILNEGASFLFFVYCRNAIDHDFFVPILEKISGVSKDENELYDDFTTIKNKEQSTALLALECYIIGMILYNESKIMGDENHIKECLKRLINNSLECLKTRSNYIDLDTYYQIISMIKNHFCSTNSKVISLRVDYMTCFFSFILTDLVLNTNDKTFNKLLDDLNKVSVPAKNILKEAFAILTRLCCDSEEQVSQQFNAHVNLVLNREDNFNKKAF